MAEPTQKTNLGVEGVQHELVMETGAHDAPASIQFKSTNAAGAVKFARLWYDPDGGTLRFIEDDTIDNQETDGAAV